MNYLQQALGKIETRQDNCPLSRHWQGTLIDPLQDFFSRPRKDLRGQIIDTGFALGALLHPGYQDDESENLELLKQILEAIHSGSLIVDDIQDNSQVRRGDTTLHRKYGIPVALNAGNWLYFFAYSLVERLKVTPEKKLLIYSALNETFYGAHFGQALDVGIRIDQIQREDQALICQNSLEMKSGLLMGLALKLGALLTPTTEEQNKIIYSFGIEFGASLQRFDDIGNLNTQCPTPKHLEDLQLRRPSWIWQYLAELGSEEEYLQFVESLYDLPDVTALEAFLNSSQLKTRCYEEAKLRLGVCIQNLKIKLNLADDNTVLQKIIFIGDQLTYAYR